MYKSILISFITTILLCNSCKSQHISSSTLKTSNLELIEILKSSYSGFTKEHFQVVKSQEELQLFMGFINRTRKPGFEVPNVNFDENSVVIYCSGETKNAHVALIIKSNTRNTITLSKKHFSAKAAGTAIISPFILYTITTDKKIIFDK